MKATEKQIKGEILRHLEWIGVVAWANNPGGRTYTTKAGVERYAPHGMAGQADITGILPDGRRLEIEVKKPGGKPAAAQWRFILAIQVSRGVAFWTDEAQIVREIMPQILAGAWVATKEDHGQELTTMWRTSPTLGPPARRRRNPK